MSSRSRTSKTTLQRRPHSPQGDTSLSSGSTSIPTDGPHKRVRSGKIAQRGWKHVKTTRGRGRTRRHAIKIDMLPDDVFLRVFDFCYTDESCHKWWHGLVHVCRRWRQLILASPRRLNLQLLCTSKKPVKKNLDFWPAIPIAIWDTVSIHPIEQDNIFAALKHRDRVRSVNLCLTTPQLEKVALAMQEPFPVLTHLRLSLNRWSEWSVPILPDGFLGGSASSLREISLADISFPALPTLLLSTRDLVDLHLYNISPTSISPEEMVTGLAATTRLKDLYIEFYAQDSFPHQRLVTPLTRVVLPALSRFHFRGDYEYLEDLVAQIDCPRLKSIFVSYHNQLVDFPVSQIVQFIDRAESLKPARFRRAHVQFYGHGLSIGLGISRGEPNPRQLFLDFPYRWSNLQIRSVKQLLNQFSAMFATVRHLSVDTPRGGQGFLGDMDNAEWLEIIHQFPAVETLRVDGKLTMVMDPVLDQLTKEMVAGVFPGLRFLNLDGRPTRSVMRFINARRLSGCPVTIVKTRMELEMLEARHETEDVGY